MIHASLFSGIGGPEVAAAMLGWENAFHCEINPFGRKILEYYFPDSESYADITKTDFTKWRGKIDVLTGGFPCQPFSYAGKRGGREDERYLWPEMLRVIKEVQPTWIVGENVAGLATMVEGGVLSEVGSEGTLFQKAPDLYQYEIRSEFTIERICQELNEAGYEVQPMLIPAAAVGAPHRRDRIFILASLADSDHRREVRISGIYASSGSEERICERHEVQFACLPNNVRRKSEEIASNASFSGAKGERRREVKTNQFRSSTNTDGQRFQTTIQRGSDGQKEWNGKGRYAFITPDKTWSKETRWLRFPTVSPVHRGNDGLPFSLDDLTISPAKWRSESLKAYGNAIVPQVMYEIFRAIEEVSKL